MVAGLVVVSGSRMTSSPRKLGQPELLGDDHLQDCGVPVRGDMRGFEGTSANDPGCQSGAETPVPTTLVAGAGGSRRPARGHAMYRSPEHEVWRQMHYRCSNPNMGNYARYGGRGIRVCAKWAGPAGFRAFLKHVGPRPSPRHTLDRIDNDGDYAPGNVRWATMREQNRNRSDNRWIEANGERLLLCDWARRLGCAHAVILKRLKHGWPPERAVTEPPRKMTKRVSGG